MDARQSAISPSNISAKLAARLGGARTLARIEYLARRPRTARSRRLLVPQSPAMKAASAHGMYMPPLTCMMLPVM